MREDINIKDKKIIVIVLLIILCLSVFGSNKIFSKKIKDNNQNNIRNKEILKEQFAMYIKNENGNYEKYEGKEFPDGYKVNLEKSSCEDANGNIVNGAISTTNSKPTITSNKTIYCTFYMDELFHGGTPIDMIEKGVKDGDLTEVVEDELQLRYHGTNPDNYICFGTKDKDECLNNQDKYMYRIIGITKETNTLKGNMLKVIKKTPIEQNNNKLFYWHNDYTTDITWPNSDLYKGLNGISGGTYNNFFIGNISYMPSGWSDKIETVNWKYGDIINNNQSASGIVQSEQAWTTTVSAKIGLMYLTDYSYAYQKSGLNCSSSGQYATCATSWIYIMNNDSTLINQSERMISRYGYNNKSDQYHAWYVYLNGIATWGNPLSIALLVRPVFYLVPTIELSGSGTITDPFLIVN